MPLIRITFISGILLVLVSNPVFVCANAEASDPGNGASMLGQPSAVSGKTEGAYLYKHPRRGYFIGIPAHVSLQDRGNKRGIIIKSRKGYQVTVQTNQTNPERRLTDMLLRLETRYLGEGKPWSRKLRQDFVNVAGLRAVETQYEGAGTRVRVIIMRGQTLDYVFIFLASPSSFNKLETEFDWMMANFKPAPADRLTVQIPARKAARTPATEGSNVFDEKTLGFSFHYPRDWVIERQGKHVVIVSGKSGSPEYFVTVSMQNISIPKGTADAGVAISGALRRLRAQILVADSDARFSGEGPYIYSRPGMSLNGGQFVVSYKQGKVGYKQWSIVLARPNANVIRYWSYAAPTNLFLTYGDIAKSILHSWIINPD